MSVSSFNGSGDVAETGTSSSQPLLIPEPIELHRRTDALLHKCLDDLEKLGLLIEPFGATAVAIEECRLGLARWMRLPWCRICLTI